MTFTLEDFDDLLTRGRPFGNSEYILDQMQCAFMRRIGEIGDQLSSARRLLESLENLDAQGKCRVLGDPLVRSAVQWALGQIEFGGPSPVTLDQCEQVFDAVIRRLELGETHGSLESAVAAPVVRLQPAYPTPWIWNEEGPSDNVFGRTFRRIVDYEYGESPCTPAPEEIALLQKSTRLLEALSPRLARSALSHTHLVAVFPGTGNWAKMASSSQFRVTGIVFLNKTVLKNPWWIAEHLLHESLHQKLYDFRHAHSLLERDDPDATGLPEDVTRVVSLWNTPGANADNAWDPHRTIAAFHVYVHLAYFCLLAERRPPAFEVEYGSPDGVQPAMTSSRKAFERARYLGEKLQTDCAPELGLAGQRMVEWLMSILDYLDPIPPPIGATFHLILDRYLMEAARLQKNPPPVSVWPRLAALAEGEAAVARAVMDNVGARVEAERLSAALNEFGIESGPYTTFPQARRVIADALRALSSDGYRVAPSPMSGSRKSADEMIGAMVENSSRELAAMGAISFHRRAPSKQAAVAHV
jgi:hypothetical protein